MSGHYVMFSIMYLVVRLNEIVLYPLSPVISDKLHLLLY